VTAATSHQEAVIGREREIEVVSAFLDSVPRARGRCSLKVRLGSGSRRSGLSLFVSRRLVGTACYGLGRARAPGLGSLSLASLHQIVRERLGFSPTRPMIARIAQASGGNPFFAIEIAHAVGGRATGPGEPAPLPVPQSVQKLAAERVSALSGAAWEAVLVAASLSRPTADAVMIALPSDLDGKAAITEARMRGCS
jgi:hypothetical protein